MAGADRIIFTVGAGAGNGSIGSSGVVPVACPVTGFAGLSKFSSVLQAVSTKETSRTDKPLDNTG
jgi:hypothetical protein